MQSFEALSSRDIRFPCRVDDSNISSAMCVWPRICPVCLTQFYQLFVTYYIEFHRIVKACIYTVAHLMDEPAASE